MCIEKLKGTNGVIRNRKSKKDRQYNGQQKKDNRQIMIYKTNKLTFEQTIPLKQCQCDPIQDVTLYSISRVLHGTTSPVTSVIQQTNNNSKANITIILSSSSLLLYCILSLGYYMVLQASSPVLSSRQTTTARLTSQSFYPAPHYCIRFWYTMYGSDVKTFNVYAKVCMFDF